MGVLWALVGLACHPIQSPPDGLDQAIVPDATVVARLDPAGVPPWSQGPPLAEPPPPQVVDDGPHGEVSRHPRVFLRFSEMMEAPPEGTPPLIRLEPEVPGVLRWTDGSQLTFRPRAALDPGQPYTVIAEGTLRTVGGRSMTLARRWQLDVDRTVVEVDPLGPQGYELYHYDGRANVAHWKTRVKVTVDRPTSLEALREHITVGSRPVGQPKIAPTRLSFDLRRPKRAELDKWNEWYGGTRAVFVVEPRGHWPAGHRVGVRVDSTFHADDDALGLAAPVVAQFETPPGLAVTLDCAIEYDDGCDPGPVVLSFDHPLTRRQLSKIHVSPRPARLKVKGEDTYGEGIHHVSVQGRFQPGESYTVSVDPGLRDIYGQPMEAAFAKSVDFVMPPPELQLSDSRGFLPADQPTTVGIESRSVTRARLRVAVLEDEAAVARVARPVDEGLFPRTGATIIERELDLHPTGRFEWSSVAIDLATFTKGERRPVFVEVMPLKLSAAAAGRTMPNPVRGLFQITDLGAFAMVSSSRSVARVSALSTGQPVADAHVQLFESHLAAPAVPMGEPTRTDDEGFAALPSTGSMSDDEGVLLVRAPAADDRFVMGPHWQPSLSAGPGKGFARGESVRATVVTERPLYRPAETIHVVGWATVSTPHTPSGLRPVPKKTPVTVTLTDRAGDVVLEREVAIKGYGKFWATLPLADDLRLGHYTVEAEVAKATATADVRLRRFRTPPFSVDAAIDAGDVEHGASPQITVGASYYFGGRVPIEAARRNDRCRPTSFRPSGLEPQWVVGSSPDPWPVSTEARRGVAIDPAQRGRLQYTMDLSLLDRAWPFRCTSSVAVQDAARAEVGAESSVMVHPSRYLLLQVPQKRVEEGDTITLPVRAVDHRAQRISGVRVETEVVRKYWKKNAEGVWKERERTLPSCTVSTTAKGDDPQCRLAALGRGRYEIKATTSGGEPRAQVLWSMWVGERWRPRRTAPVERLTLEVSDPEPRPGDRVTVTVRSPRTEAMGVISLMHGGLRSVEPFELHDGRYEHSFTVLDAWVPTVQVEAVLVHPATAKRDKLFEREAASMRVTAEHRALQVQVSAPDVSSPRETIPISLTLHDVEGQPVSGHVTLWAVDEAVLSLAEPIIPDLVAAFVVDRGPQTEFQADYDQRLHPYVVQGDSYAFGWAGGLSLTGGGAGGGGTGFGGGHGSVGGAQPMVRDDFDPTPIFLGDVAIGPSGRATTEGTLPDNLTTFRITAIASAELVGGDAVGRFGHADTRVRVTAPLVVQAALPRHLRPGDQAEFAALIDNLGGPAGLVTVQADLDDADGVAKLSSIPTKVARVEAGGQIRVPFELEALGPGKPRITVRATLAAEQGDVRLSDAIALPVPIAVERNLVRQVAVYGSLADDEPAAIAVKRPVVATTGPGGIDVALSSTLLGGVQDLAVGLVQYPYGCLEQTSSRMLPLAAIGELAKHYPLGVGDLDVLVRTGVTRLQSLEVSTGGLGYWPGDTQAHVYATAYATWILQLLDDAGYAVPSRFLHDLRGFLAEQIEDWASHGTPTVHDDIRLAMALHALAAGNEAPAKALTAIYERRDRLPLFTRAVVLLALVQVDADDPRVDALVQELLGGLDERDGFAHVRDDGRWIATFFDSGPRTEAMVLLALLHAAPDDRRVQKLAKGMMELQRAGAMRNTQERAYTLLALGEYARRFEAEVPAFDSGVWVGADLVGQQRFEGRTANVEAYRVPLPWAEAPAAEDRDATVTLSRRGEGRMYYRVGLRWTPVSATLEPHAAGIAVERALRIATGPVEPGGTITHGDLVALDLTVTTNDTLDYVAIDIPLPAGLEAVDTTIGKGRRAMVLTGHRGWWVSHTELQAERSLVFADRLSPGTHRHTVFLRAITPGTYTMPPTKAEAMYYPEIQGYTGADTVQVVR